MGIVTKKGDKGKTFLYGGARVYKDDIVIEACGCLDELVSFIGLSKSLVKDKKIKGALEEIQKDLFVIGSEVSAGPKSGKKLKIIIAKSYINRLDDEIKEFESEKVFDEKGFCLSGKDSCSSSLDLSRAIARKLERRLVTLKRKKLFNNENALVYINRLSDYLFLLARYVEKND